MNDLIGIGIMISSPFRSNLSRLPFSVLWLMVFSLPTQALTIVPSFEAGFSAADKTVINQAISFYQNTFSNPISVSIDFANMSTGLGESLDYTYHVSYQSFSTALDNHLTAVGDTTALASVPRKY